MQCRYYLIPPIAAHHSYFNPPALPKKERRLLNLPARALTQLWVIHEAKHLACTCLDFCFILPSAMRAFWNGCLTEIDPVVPTHCCLVALHPAITSRFPPLPLFLFLCSSAAATFGIPPPRRSYHLPAFFFSQSTSNKGSTPPPSPPHFVSLLVFVCFMLAPDRESWGVLYREILRSLPALILDNRKRTCFSQFNYWQFCVQRCVCVCSVCVCTAVGRLSRTSVCRPEQNGDVCCSPLHSIHFHPQFVFGLMIVCRLSVGGVFINIFRLSLQTRALWEGFPARCRFTSQRFVHGKWESDLIWISFLKGMCHMLNAFLNTGRLWLWSSSDFIH